MYCSVLQCIVVCCSVLQCVAVCCSVLQCVAACLIHTIQRSIRRLPTCRSFTFWRYISRQTPKNRPCLLLQPLAMHCSRLCLKCRVLFAATCHVSNVRKSEAFWRRGRRRANLNRIWSAVLVLICQARRRVVWSCVCERPEDRVIDAHLCAIAYLTFVWLVRSIKLHVSFAKEPYVKDNILQKRPMILSILLTVATP